MIRSRAVLVAALVVVLAGGAAFAQFRGGGWARMRRVPPRFPASEAVFDGGFNFCRVMYSSQWSEAGGQGWSTDYPDAEINFSIRFAELTKTRVSKHAQCDGLVDHVAEPTVELDDRRVGCADLQVNLRAAGFAEQTLRLGHQGASVAASLAVRGDRQVIDPSPVPFVAGHYRGDDPVLDGPDQKKVRADLQLAADVLGGVVPRTERSRTAARGRSRVPRRRFRRRGSASSWSRRALSREVGWGRCRLMVLCTDQPSPSNGMEAQWSPPSRPVPSTTASRIPSRCATCSIWASSRAAWGWGWGMRFGVLVCDSARWYRAEVVRIDGRWRRLRAIGGRPAAGGCRRSRCASQRACRSSRT